MNRPIHLVAFVTFVMIAGGGCAHTRSIWVAGYELGGDMVTRPAPQTAVYRVKWSAQRDGKSFGVEASERIIDAGERLGFRTELDGRVTALAGDEEFVLDGLNPDARYCVWSSKYEETNEFGRAVGAVGNTATTASFLVGGFVLAAVVDQAGDQLSRWLDRGTRSADKHRSKDRKLIPRDNTPPPATQASR